MKVIYSRYNRFRLPQFQIETQILREKNRKLVLKKALTEQARQHIMDISRGRELLKAQIRDPNLKVSEIIEKNMDSVCFEFIEGISFDKKVFDEIVQKNRKGFFALIESYHGLLTNAFATTGSLTEACPFFDADAIAVLAEESLFHPIAWLDPVLDNLLWIDDFCYLVDTEWVFPYSVPVSFEFFRGISFLYSKYQEYGIHQLFPFSELLQYYGFSEDKTKKYFELENVFQEYVHGKDRKYFIFSKYLQNAYPFCPGNIKSNHELHKITSHHIAQLFVDTGCGFNKTESITKPVHGTERTIEFDLSSFHNIKALRFDPLNDLTAIHLDHIHLVVEEGNIIPIEQHQTNACYQKGNYLIFDTKDPIIALPFSVEHAQKFVISMEYVTLGNDTYPDLLKWKDAELNEKIQLLNAMENTFSWKITKPLRMFRNHPFFRYWADGF